MYHVESEVFSIPGSGLGVSSDLSKLRHVHENKMISTERPYFDDIGPRNVTAIVGQSAVLKCRVKHPGDRTVSNWNYLIILNYYYH